MLASASLLVFILVARKKIDIFKVASLVLIFAGSVSMCGVSVYGIFVKDKLMLFNAVSAQIFSWFHNIFALEYLSASLIVPIKLTEEESDEKVAKIRKYSQWIRAC